MARTSSAAVQLLLAGEYDSAAATDLTPYIEIASAIVDQVVACMTARGLTPASASVLEIIERTAAARYYQMVDPGYTSRSTANKSGSFLDTKDNRFRTALMELSGLTGGCLGAILKGNVASAAWGGKTVPEQLDFDQRN